MKENECNEPSSRKWTLILAAWVSMLLVSDLPDILLQKVFLRPVPSWIFWAKATFFLLFLGLCFAWKKMRPLREYGLVMSVFFLALGIFDWVGSSAWWQLRFSPPRASFTTRFTGAFIRDIGVALCVIAALWLVKGHRSRFFLVMGKLDAPIGPVRWLGIRQGESWRTFGLIFAGVATLGVAIPTFIGAHISREAALAAVVLLPVALAFSIINAFTEEVYYRASLLSTLYEVIGKNHTLMINAVFFGLAHYLYGSPPGIVGFLMTGFLAWILGKSMLETRGMFWPWFIHFLPDVVIFVSYVLIN